MCNHACIRARTHESSNALHRTTPRHTAPLVINVGLIAIRNAAVLKTHTSHPWRYAALGLCQLASRGG